MESLKYLLLVLPVEIKAQGHSKVEAGQVQAACLSGLPHSTAPRPEKRWRGRPMEDGCG